MPWYSGARSAIGRMPTVIGVSSSSASAAPAASPSPADDESPSSPHAVAAVSASAASTPSSSLHLLDTVPPSVVCASRQQPGPQLSHGGGPPAVALGLDRREDAGAQVRELR